jgi:Asparagine synthase
MFGFLGAQGKSVRRFGSAVRAIEESFGEPLTIHDCNSANMGLATMGEADRVLGVAVAGAKRLILFGAVHGPFPMMYKGSTLDDPSRTAALLLDRYTRCGDAFLDEVVGHYALALVDGEQDRLLLARDPYSGPRIFVYETDECVSFSTRLVDFADLLGEQAKLDRSLEDFLLGYEFLPDERTLVAGVKALPRGKILAWQAGERVERSVKAMMPTAELIADASSRNEETVMKGLYEAFIDSLKDQLPSHGKIGVLQGGFDSMLITAILSRLGREVETFTFRYQESGYTQEMTEELARLLGVRHNWVDITPQVIEDGLTRFSDNFNQPVGQAHYLIASAEATRVMRQRGITHCMTGDGCDGLFLGYPTVYQRARFVKRISIVRGLIAPLVMAVGSWKWFEQKLGHPYRFVRNIARVISRPEPARGHIAACTLDATSLRFLRCAHPPQEESVEEILERLAKGLGDVEPLRLAYMGKGRVGLNAAKLEGIMGIVGIPMLSPYLHPRMLGVAEHIPDNMNRPQKPDKMNTTGKYIFMRMVDRYDLLPKVFVHQRKMSPVMAPVDFWYWNELQKSTIARINELPFEIDRSYVCSLVTPKVVERTFRDRVGISRYVCQAAGLLATYASFARRFAKRGGQGPSTTR